MKNILFILLIFSISFVKAQDNKNYVYYDNLMDLVGTEYVMTSTEEIKKYTTKQKKLMFINTLNGESKTIDFPIDSYIQKVEYVALDTIKLYKVIVSAKISNANGNKSIDWDDPTQIIVISPDGSNQTTITEENFFVTRWVLNRNSGNLVIIGRTDTNNNKKIDKSDKYETIIYNLKNMSIVRRL